MLNINRIVKNEVIDMADMVEDLQETVRKQDKKMDTMVQMITVLMAQVQIQGGKGAPQKQSNADGAERQDT